MCGGATNLTYSIAPVVGVIITIGPYPQDVQTCSGQGTNSIIVNFGSTNGTISLVGSNDCNANTSTVNKSFTIVSPLSTPLVNTAIFFNDSSAVLLTALSGSTQLLFRSFFYLLVLQV
ncbi:MAG: hypothetical protein IPG89_15935 [Bacteroidetes bacterium]|nr:hypothetical protein [Bacteroidota bacterium]